MGILEEKSELRKRMKRLRSILPMGQYRENCRMIQVRCMALDAWDAAGTVHIYIAALNNEVDTLGLVYRLFDTGKRVVVPRCGENPRELENIRIESFDELRCGKYGVMEPVCRPERMVPSSELDLVVIPLLAFDRKGRRLGFGGGYYDGLLGECSCPRIGLAYDFQEVERVPAEPHDEKLDIIVTQKEVIQVNEHG